MTRIKLFVAVMFFVFATMLLSACGDTGGNDLVSVANQVNSARTESDLSDLSNCQRGKSIFEAIEDCIIAQP